MRTIFMLSWYSLIGIKHSLASFHGFIFAMVSSSHLSAAMSLHLISNSASPGLLPSKVGAVFDERASAKIYNVEILVRILFPVFPNFFNNFFNRESEGPGDGYKKIL